jgi:hypothetical protein
MLKASPIRLLATCAIVMAVAVVLWAASARPVQGGGQTAAGPAHYTVVMTEGHNLLVTDNATNKLFFYTIDKDKPIGSPLKLRASVDLAKVGEEEIQITAHNLEKVEK